MRKTMLYNNNNNDIIILILAIQSDYSYNRIYKAYDNLCKDTTLSKEEIKDLLTKKFLKEHK